MVEQCPLKALVESSSLSERTIACVSPKGEADAISVVETRMPDPELVEGEAGSRVAEGELVTESLRAHQI